MQTAYLLPLTVLSLMLAVLALGYRSRRGRGPLALGVAASVVLLVGKFILDSGTAVGVGVAALVGASLWNLWPVRPAGGIPFASWGPLLQIGRLRKGEANVEAKRKIEVFNAGCPACQEVVALVQRVACPSCEVSVLDMNDPAVAARAKALGVRAVPAVAIDGRLADCCQGSGPDEAALRAAGLGSPIA